MFFNKSLILFLNLISLICLIACESSPPNSSAAPTVLYKPLKTEEVVLKRTYPGRVAAAEIAEIRPQAGGILLERLFEEGDEVKAGQVLYRIDDAPFKAAWEEARAVLEKAESREKAARKHMERCIKLAANKAVPIRERDDAIAAYNAVEAEIKAAREQLKKAEIERGYTEITAPISGIIGRSLIQEGSLVTSNQQQPMAIINQLNPVYVDIPLPVSDMLSLRKGSETEGAAKAIKGFADIGLEDGSWLTDDMGKRQQCEALFSETRADEMTGTVTLRLSCANTAQLLLPGMYVKANIPLQTIKNALLVPKRSVGRDSRNRPVVYILKNEKDNLFRLEERPVSFQMETANAWVLADGLHEGELLLVEGLQKAGNGLLVQGKEK